MTYLATEGKIETNNPRPYFTIRCAVIKITDDLGSGAWMV